MMPFHLDLNLVIGIAGGMIGIAGVFRTSKVGALKSELETQGRKIGELVSQLADLGNRCQTFEIERDAARRDLREHFATHLAVTVENRELNQLVRERDDTIISIQREMLDLQKNSLRALA